MRVYIVLNVPTQYTFAHHNVCICVCTACVCLCIVYRVQFVFVCLCMCVLVYSVQYVEAILYCDYDDDAMHLNCLSMFATVGLPVVLLPPPLFQLLQFLRKARENQSLT